ncbi:MAG: hypothetical protein LBT45_03985 [Rickettsiales bacterium]|jgi:hypothetical protein|nr:hypothetical protein [Rickettsiales bacterium]
MAKDTDEFARKIVNRYIIKNIVDDVFLAIQSNDDAMEDYLDLIESRVLESKAGVAKAGADLREDIKASIKNLLDLEGIGTNKHPESHLIESYVEHRLARRGAIRGGPTK